jgi:LysM repeat protein
VVTFSGLLPVLPNPEISKPKEVVRFFSSSEGKTALRLDQKLRQVELPPVGLSDEATAVRYPGGKRGKAPPWIVASQEGRKGQNKQREGITPVAYTGIEVVGWLKNLGRLRQLAAARMPELGITGGVTPSSRGEEKGQPRKLKKALQGGVAGLTAAGAVGGIVSCAPQPRAAVIQEIPKEEMQSGIQILEIRPMPVPRPTPDNLKTISALPQAQERPAVISSQEETTPTVAATPTAAEILQKEKQPFAVTYVVQTGDNLKQLAQTYGLSVEEIIRENNLTDSDSIRAGQELIIPMTEEEFSQLIAETLHGALEPLSEMKKMMERLTDDFSLGFLIGNEQAEYQGVDLNLEGIVEREEGQIPQLEFVYWGEDFGEFGGERFFSTVPWKGEESRVREQIYEVLSFLEELYGPLPEEQRDSIIRVFKTINPNLRVMSSAGMSEWPTEGEYMLLLDAGMIEDHGAASYFSLVHELTHQNEVLYPSDIRPHFCIEGLAVFSQMKLYGDLGRYNWFDYDEQNTERARYISFRSPANLGERALAYSMAGEFWRRWDERHPETIKAVNQWFQEQKGQGNHPTWSEIVGQFDSLSEGEFSEYVAENHIANPVEFP